MLPYVKSANNENCTSIENISLRGTSMYYVITKGGGGGGRKWQFLITFSTESNHKGGRGGGSENPKS